MKFLRILFLLIVFPVAVAAQKKQLIDSLEKLYQQSSSDTQKFNRLTDLIKAYRLGNTQKAGEKCQELLVLANQIDIPLYSARATFYLAVQKRKEGDYDTAITLYLQALPVFDQYKDESDIAAAYGSLGIMYWQQEDLVLAADYLKKALVTMRKLGRTENVLANLNNLAGVFQQQKKTDSAVFYLKEMISIAEGVHDTSSLADAYGNLGAVYLENGDTAAALPYALLGAKYAEQTGYNYQLLTSSGNLGQIFLMEKRYKDAEKYLLRASALADSLQSPENKLSNYKMLALLYEAEGDSGLANRFLNKYSDLHDTLLNESRMKQMTEMDAKYQSAKKDKELISEKARSEKKTMMLYSLGIGLALVIALAFFAWRGYRNKKRSSEEIQKQKEIIEWKSNEILASIHYAERIQRAILPPPETFSSFFSDSFLLYIPKDIVSGDFYWMHKEKDQVLIAVGDCTGHGVPGAFMSMLGIDKLNEIVKAQTDPSGILFDLNRSVKATLHQAELNNESLPPVKETNVQDGMDISVISFDRKFERMRYAGANRPAWIHNRANGWKELKPTKAAIGGYTSEDLHFDTQEISLEKGDTVYLFSDGFADQFGGAEGKKIMTKRFRDWLSEIQHLPMNEQQKALSEKFHRWKGNVEQVDDVLLVGIRI